MGLAAHAGRPSAASYIASMTEDQARQVLLLQAQESAGDTPTWQPADRSWATRQTVATVGEQATPETFVVARAALALQRLLPRDPAAQRWLGRRAWHPAWVALALLLGLMAGLAVDQLGPPQRVNLLAPAVWVLVAWNLLVYAALLLPLKLQGVRGWLSRWALRGHEHVAVAWARHAAPLTGARLALVLHAAAATLALGLVAGLYLRGLVLDYRAGWQSTFATADQVQTALRWLLAPASAITGIAVPDVAPLRVGPGADATASAAPWIHLLAATLLLAVVLPRSLLAWRAGVRATKLTQRFPLPLDTPYFEALHPLMRPGLPPTVRLLWLNLVEATADGPPVRLFDTLIERDIHAVQTLLRSEEGDTLQLHPVPAGVEGALVPAAAAPWWQTWWPAGATLKSPLARLRDDTDAVLLLTRPGAAEPAWLAALDRPALATHHARHFNAANLTLAIAGDFEPAAVLEIIREKFAGLPVGDRWTAPASQLAPGSNLTRHLPKKQAVLAIGFPGSTISGADRHALAMIQEYASDMAGPLFSRIREELGLAYQVGATQFLGYDAGLFSFYLATSPSQADFARSELLAEIAKIAAHGIPTEAFERVRSTVLSGLAIQQQSPASIARHVALDLLFGHPADQHRRLPEAYKALTASAVAETAHRIFSVIPTVVMVLPED